MARRRRTTDEHHYLPAEVAAMQADLNEVVAYNFRAARELRGWTQEQTARALEGLLGQLLPQASISAIERAYKGDRKREFDAHEIFCFALAFDLPMIWFFLPPPGDHRTLHDASTGVNELYGIVLGQGGQLEPLYARLREIGVTEPDERDRIFEQVSGGPSPARKWSYRERRKAMLLALLDDYADDVDRAAEELGVFVDRLRALGIRTLVAERQNDVDLSRTPEHRRAIEEFQSSSVDLQSETPPLPGGD